MAKATDTFRRMKFWLPQILPLSTVTYAASRESNIELLILISDFVMNSMLKNNERYFCEIHVMS